MKKVLLAVLSAALLAAVMISAGCVSTDTEAVDSISGVWIAGDDKNVCMYIFDEDEQAGVYYSTYADEKYARDGIYFLWENEGNGVYSLTYVNGGEERCVLDLEKGTLTSDDKTVFVNLVKELGDSTDDAIVGVWAAKDAEGSYLFAFNEDNTCVYYSTDKKEEAEEGLEYVWVNNGDSTYTLTSAKEEGKVTLDVKAGTLTTYDNAVFKQVTIDDALEGKDAVSGVWVSEDELGSYLIVFEDNLTGLYYSTDPAENSETGTPFTWKAEGNGIYTLTKADGKSGSWTLDAKAGTLTASKDSAPFVKVTFKNIISEEDDAVIGLWGYIDEDGYYFYVFNEDGTGEYGSTEDDNQRVGEFTWKNDGKGSYSLSYPTGFKETCVLDETEGTLIFDDDTVFVMI